MSPPRAGRAKGARLVAAATVLAMTGGGLFLAGRDASAPDVRRAPPTAVGAVAPAVDQVPAPAERGADRVSRSDERVTSGLDVTMDSLSPARLVPGQRLRLGGTITNVDALAWGNVKVYLVVDREPTTQLETVRDVVASEPDAVTGERLAEIGQFLELGDIAPGQSVGYQLDLGYAELGLSGAAGAYTIGVHALADPPQGGERVTAGRVRTLMPLIPAGTTTSSVPLGVLLPLSTPLRRAADGTYDDLDGLLEQVAVGGRLRNVLDLAATAETGQVTLLLDPALLDALRAVVADDFGPPGEPVSAPGGDGGGDAGGGDGEGGADGGEPTARPDPATPVDGIATEQQREVAGSFLDRLRDVADQHPVLATPYGHADLDAVRTFGGPALVRTVERTGASALGAVGIDADPAVRPAGQLDPGTLRTVARERLVVLRSDQITGWRVTDGAGVRLLEADPAGDTGAAEDPAEGPDPGGGAPAVVTDASLAAGAPAPGVTDTPIQLRQRLLTETALLALTGGDPGQLAPAVAFSPVDGWDPGPPASSVRLFDGLDAPWVSASGVGALLAGDDAAVVRARDEADLEDATTVGEQAVQRAREVRLRATTAQSLFQRDSALLAWYDRGAVLLLSDDQRLDPADPDADGLALVEELDRTLAGVTVEGPPFVRLSGESGNFPITLTNDLERPVQVGVTLTDTSGRLTFDDPGVQEIAPGQSAQLNLDIDVQGVGSTTVTAALVTPSGRTFGEPAAFQVSSSVVSTVIWVGLAASAFFGVLLARRVRRRRAEAGG